MTLCKWAAPGQQAAITRRVHHCRHTGLWRGTAVPALTPRHTLAQARRPVEARGGQGREACGGQGWEARGREACGGQGWEARGSQGQGWEARGGQGQGRKARGLGAQQTWML